jgi:hypothetical protein
MQGGGFCTSSSDCQERAKTDLGSSTNWSDEDGMQGVLDGDASQNPFYYFNRVFVKYCDGFFFTGNADHPISLTDGTHLHMRGRRNIEAVFQTLKSDFGLDKASDVLLGGGSAGGLATYLQGDFLASLMSPANVRTVPTSGFFPVVPNYQGGTAFLDSFLNGITFHNATGGLEGSPCLEAVGKANARDCMYANNSFNFMSTRTFILNSAIDQYSIDNIWQADTECADSGFQSCTDENINDLNSWGLNIFLAQFHESAGSSRAGNGAFISSCFEHCAAEQNGAFNGIKINGIAESAALATWFKAPATDPSASHTYYPCALTLDAPHICNPTCSTVQASGSLRGVNIYDTRPRYRNNNFSKRTN